jgi:diguanylate cyclase (GGDEF)-like protein/PAS domain S-box-containing protein
VLGLLIISLAGLSLWVAETNSNRLDAAQARSDSAIGVEEAATSFLSGTVYAQRYINSQDPTFAQQLQVQHTNFNDQLDQTIAAESRLGDGGDSAVVIETKEAFASIWGQLDSVVQQVQAGDSSGAQASLTQILDASQVYSTALETYMARQRSQVVDANDAAASSAKTLATAIIIAIIGTLIFCAAAVLWLIRSVVRPLSHLSDTAAAIARGERTNRSTSSGPIEVQKLSSVLYDMEERVAQRETDLRNSEEYWRSLVQNGQDIITVFNMDFSVAYQSPAALRILGYTEQEVKADGAMRHIHPDDMPAAQQSLRDAIGRPGQSVSVEFRIEKKHGGWVTLDAAGSLVRLPDGKEVMIFNARDVTERKQAADTIAHMAYHDALTGLPNRPLLTDRLDVAMAQARRDAERVCLLALDLDRFKIINDTLGHAIGDELLNSAAKRLENVVREGNTVARMGGDEFIVLIGGCQSVDDGITVAQRLITAFRQPFQLSAGSYHATTSIGLSVYPDDGEDAESLLRAADVAMYAAKDAGRDTFRHYNRTMDEKDAAWLEMEAELRRALDEGELCVHYQPQVSISDNSIVGVEALVRWDHPTRGMIAPMEFIPLAEETGIITTLGEFVLRRAATDAMQWQKDGLPPVRLAVNVSHRQFADQHFIETVRRILHETGFDPSLLELEITETAALRNIDRTRSVAIALSEIGVRLSIDDFGAGSTSLRYLQDFPITTLKIDRSFITGVGANPSNSAIATSVIALGHQLNLNIIAEGVESKDDLEFLQSRDCDEYQGYYCSRPVPNDQIRKLIADQPALPNPTRTAA